MDVIANEVKQSHPPLLLPFVRGRVCVGGETATLTLFVRNDILVVICGICDSCLRRDGVCEIILLKLIQEFFSCGFALIFK